MNILEADFDPEFIQIISWNDYGESHCQSSRLTLRLQLVVAVLLADEFLFCFDDELDIGPILGAQPGSERWTNGMSHEGWRQLTSWFIRRYQGVPLSAERVSR
jgi:glucan endo-1,3-alpha-glucosidase